MGRCPRCLNTCFGPGVHHTSPSLARGKCMNGKTGALQQTRRGQQRLAPAARQTCSTRPSRRAPACGSSVLCCPLFPRRTWISRRPARQPRPAAAPTRYGVSRRAKAGSHTLPSRSSFAPSGPPAATVLSSTGAGGAGSGAYGATMAN